ERIAEQNKRVAAQRRRRDLVAGLSVPATLSAGQLARDPEASAGLVALDELARALYHDYRDVRAQQIADRLLRLTARGNAPTGASTGQRLRNPEALREALERHLRALPPERFPAPGEDVVEWYALPDTVERTGVVVLDLLRRGLGLLPASATEARTRIATMRGG